MVGACEDPSVLELLSDFTTSCQFPAGSTIVRRPIFMEPVTKSFGLRDSVSTVGPAEYEYEIENIAAINAVTFESENVIVRSR